MSFKSKTIDLIRKVTAPNIEAKIVIQSPHNTLAGRTILVTGGGSGIGRAIAERSVREGAEVIIAGRNLEKLQIVSSEIGCKCFKCDVAEEKDFVSVFERAEDLFGHSVDTLVSNAGVSFHEGGFEDVTRDGWDAQMNTNLKGGFFICQAFVSYVESCGLNEATILVVTSERARRPDDIPYGLTKIASDSYIQALAPKLIKRRIRINGLAPGVTCTDLTGYSADENLYNNWQNNGRLFLAEEVAEVANFLLGDASRCISGEIIACNQGNHIATW